MNVERIVGVEQLRAMAGEWDDLWWRSESYLPSARAEPLAMWHEHFSPKWTLRAVLVRDSGKLVAVFPFEARGVWPGFGRLPYNDWFPGGMPFVDQNYETRELVEHLLDGLQRERCHVFALRNVRWESPWWRLFLEAIEARRWPLHHHPLYEVGTVDLTRPWSDLQGGFTANHRHKMRKAWRRAEREGGIGVWSCDWFDVGELDSLLRAGFELERAGWKGREGTAILQRPGFFEFVRRVSEYLAREKQLRLAHLRLGEQNIAFEYTWVAKGVVTTPKVAYDERYAWLSPGQQLLHWSLQELSMSSAYRWLDYVGPATESTRRCSTGSYTTGTVVIGQPGLWGPAGVWAYQRRRAWKQRSPVAARGESP